jgi:ATP:corrinoid adenosyltransferase
MALRGGAFGNPNNAGVVSLYLGDGRGSSSSYFGSGLAYTGD